MNEEVLSEVGYVYEKAKELAEKRERDYDGAWRNVGLGGAVEALYRKASRIRARHENGRFREDAEGTKDDILDLINWGVFYYKLVDEEA